MVGALISIMMARSSQRAGPQSAAERAFGQRGLVEITYLTGIYHTVCALLNAFEIPAPGS